MSESTMEGGATIPVHCSHDAMVALEKLVPQPRNPNQHSNEQIALLAKIIAATGWRDRITVSKRSGFIVAGHARYAAAKVLGVDAAPVDYQDFVDEATEWAHMLADNRISELSETNKDVLKDLLTEMDVGSFDTDLTGFTKDTIESMMTATVPAEEKADEQREVKCPNCGNEFTPSAWSRRIEPTQETKQ